MSERETITLGDRPMSIADLVRIARDPSVRVARSADAEDRVRKSADIVASAAASYKAAWVRRQDDSSVVLPLEYGVTTGFGEFKDKPIPPGELEELQRNLLLSHSVGVGENTNRRDLANYYAPEVVRGALATRFNAFLKGHSGIRIELLDIVQAMLNCGVIPLVPLRGSVGASGDLCPLSHLFVTLLGHGELYRVSDAASLHETRPEILPASRMFDVLREEIPGLTREAMLPTFKEGLALTNGANFSAAMLALGVHDAMTLADAADVALSMTLEAMGGSARAFDPKVHAAREHPGQIATAARVRELLTKSRWLESAGAVQDVYSLRCAPQVHGASRDAIDYVAAVATREINSATDNPLFFPDGGEPWDLSFRQNWQNHYDGSKRQAYSAGNFHGQPIALAADFLAIALAEIANISERRTQLLLDGHHNRNLPENLTTRPGVNSGFMIAQYTAASLVSENKVLSHPASVDSIPTSSNSEDHVSMSTHAARKMRTVLGNVQSVIAIELLAASQALEWRIAFEIPARGGLDEKELRRYRPDDVDAAKTQADAFQTRVAGNAETLAKSIAPALQPFYLAVRRVSPPLIFDRPLDEDIRNVRDLIASGGIQGGKS